MNVAIWESPSYDWLLRSILTPQHGRVPTGESNTANGRIILQEEELLYVIGVESEELSKASETPLKQGEM